MQASDFMIRYGYVSNVTMNSYICYVPTPRTYAKIQLISRIQPMRCNAITPIAEFLENRTGDRQLDCCKLEQIS